MVLSRFFLCSGATLFLASVGVADPTATVRAALQDFLDQPNYTWAVSGSRGMPEPMNGAAEQDVGGQHEKGGYTKVYFARLPLSPVLGTRTNRPTVGFSDEQSYWASRWVFDTPEGWRLLSELPAPEVMGPRTPPKRPGLINIPIAKIGFSQRWIGTSRPDYEIAIILTNLSAAEDLGTGAFRIELTPKGETLLAGFPRSPIGFNVGVENARVAVEVRLRKGVLVAYELAIEADRILPIVARRHHVDYKRVRELTDLGTTIIEVPDEVARKLGR